MSKIRNLFFPLLATGLLLLGGALHSYGKGAGKAFGAASGKYKGNARGQIISQLLGTATPLRKTSSFVKLPRGKGRFLANFGGVIIKGRVTKASVRQGGRKVVIVASGKLPPVLTAPLGAGPGPGFFRGSVKLKGKNPKLTGNGVFAVPNLIRLNVRFRGDK